MPWPLYAAMMVCAFTLVHINYKLVAGSVTPIMFAFIINLVNFSGHLLNVVRNQNLRSVARPGAVLAMPLSMWMLAGLVGFLVAINDISGIMIYMAGAPMSIAMPSMSVGVIMLSAAFGVMILKERPTHMQGCGVVIGIIGVVLLNV